MGVAAGQGPDPLLIAVVEASSTLRERAVSATVWSGTDTLLRLGVRFVVTMLLARLLTPTDYGTIGLLDVFIGLAAVFIESGFSSALIQRKDISDLDLSSVFYFNLGIALLASVTLCSASSWIAAFYGMPILIPLTYLLSGTLVIGAAGSIQSMLLMKSLNFRRQCAVTLASTAISGATAVYLAWKGWGVWSLGVQVLVATTVSTALLWLLSSWRPRLQFSVSAVGSLFRFGGFLLVSGLSDTLFTRINSLVIGKLFSPRDLGYYSRADGTQQLPAGLLSGVIGRVAFPVFSAAHGEKDLLQRGLRKAITTVMMINMPIMFGLAVTARSVVLVLFGEQWLPSVPYLQILSLGGVLWPLHVLNLNVLKAQGHSNLFFRLELTKKVIGAILLGGACVIGMIAIAWSLVVASLICFSINAHYSGKLLDYGVLRQSWDLQPYLGGSMVVVAGAWAVTLLPIHAPLLVLSSQVLVGVVAYVSYCAALRPAAFIEVRQIATGYLGAYWCRAER